MSGNRERIGKIEGISFRYLKYTRCPLCGDDAKPILSWRLRDEDEIEIGFINVTDKYKGPACTFYSLYNLSNLSEFVCTFGHVVKEEHSFYLEFFQHLSDLIDEGKIIRSVFNR